LNSTAHAPPWPAGPARPDLQPDQLHVWVASLAPAPDRLRELSAVLAPDELDRAARFRFDVHRNRFIAGRGILRLLLARYLDAEAASLGFTYSSHGKPSLAGSARHALLQFNLAHSGDLALLAVTRVGPIGVDVEEIREVKEVDDLVARFFSVRESALFQGLPAAEKPAAFFNLWTRKEALLKATGDGITGGLNRVEVTFLASETARLLALNGVAADAEPWTLEALHPQAGAVGAVALRARNVSVTCWRWE
jgi:4'-phosphopantetheinyl transferase